MRTGRERLCPPHVGDADPDLQFGVRGRGRRWSAPSGRIRPGGGRDTVPRWGQSNPGFPRLPPAVIEFKV